MNWPTAAPHGGSKMVSPARPDHRHEVARALGVRFLFTERDGGKMICDAVSFSREAAVVVEDVITTGGAPAR
jgi:orotate phosphoribosyltransferase